MKNRYEGVSKQPTAATTMGAATVKTGRCRPRAMPAADRFGTSEEQRMGSRLDGPWNR